MSAAFDDFVAIIARLRAPDGCPWDRAQTPQTLRRYLLEEAYEALEAIDLDDAQRLKEELGDILLQIVLQSQIASETGAFTLDDVIANIHAKIIRRHPHVFGDQQGATVEQIEENWEQIKRAEKKPGAQVSSFLGDIPKGLPALAESEDMQQRAWRVGLWNGDPSEAERETARALNAWHARLDAVSLGDALFRLVDRARREGLDAESALREANQRFAKSLQPPRPIDIGVPRCLPTRAPGANPMSARPISRYPVPDIVDLPQDLRERILAVQEKSGFVPNVFLALAHRPEECRAFFAYHDALMEKDSGLSKAEREMIVVATSAANQCQYCVVAHGAILRIRAKNPLIADQVATNYRSADLTPRQLAMLDFAMLISQEAEQIEDADFDTLRAHGFSDEDIWDIGAVSAFFALSNRMAHLLNMRPNDEFYLMGRVPKQATAPPRS